MSAFNLAVAGNYGTQGCSSHDSGDFPVSWCCKVPCVSTSSPCKWPRGMLVCHQHDREKMGQSLSIISSEEWLGKWLCLCWLRLHPKGASCWLWLCFSRTCAGTWCFGNQTHLGRQMLLLQYVYLYNILPSQTGCEFTLHADIGLSAWWPSCLGLQEPLLDTPIPLAYLTSSTTRQSSSCPP